MENTEILENLNNAQREAVTTTEGFVRVIAGAGSGKTRALTRRFVYLVTELGIAPGNIMCVTFTNKAAQEMKKRIYRLTGDKDTAYINTFHGFCVTVLSEESNAVHYPKSFLVLDNSDINSMLDIIYEERHLTSRDMTYGKARDMIEMQKCIKKPLYYKDLIEMSLEELKLKYLDAEDVHDIIFYGYLYQQKKCFGLDYNDLIIFTLHIFNEDEEIRLKWQMRLEYIMIDEYQDIDALQYKLMKVLCQYHRNLFVVGDPDQTIYSWRGADVRYLLNFNQEFPDAITIMMNDNYRSTPEIIDTANSLISKNSMRIDKQLAAHRKHGPKTLYHHAKTAEDEATWIAGQIQKLTALTAGGEADKADKTGEVDKTDKYDEADKTDGHAGAPLVRPGEISILVRAHYLTANLEKVFIERKLPYRIYSGVQFFERTEIQVALGYLRMVAFKDDLSFVRVVNTPKRNFGKSRMSYLKECAEREGTSLFDALVKHLDDDRIKGSGVSQFIELIDEISRHADNLNVSELLTRLLEKSGYEKVLRTEGSQERLDNLAELKQLIYEYEATCGEETDLVHFLEHISLYTNTDSIDEPDKIKIMTVHAAKGLEFPYVFVCGMSEGIFPSKKSRTTESLEEERRLCFVAYTRARDRLFLSDAEGESFIGFRYPSRFVLELEDKAVEYEEPLDDGLLLKARNEYKAIDRILRKDSSDNNAEPSFEIGATVHHKVFGNGIVFGIDEETRGYIVKFTGLKTARNISRDKLEALK